uniref:Uncharacterized protein n=1 Tax=Arundo donax TaxID=35708 RepID=A0A0A9BM73_ARUDO
MDTTTSPLHLSTRNAILLCVCVYVCVSNPSSSLLLILVQAQDKRSWGGEEHFTEGARQYCYARESR